MSIETTFETPKVKPQCEEKSLRAYIKEVTSNYLDALDGKQPQDLYELMKAEMEIPLYEKVLSFTGGNKSDAAKILGFSRQTLYAKLKKYQNDIDI